MKAVLITELDSVKEFPVNYILKPDGQEELVGCCPRAFFNFFGLIGGIEELNSSFLFWLKSELQEDDSTLITPINGLQKFIRNPIFEKLECSGGNVYDYNAVAFLGQLSEGFILFAHLIHQGIDYPSHCVVFHMKNGFLYADGEEISLETFTQELFCHEKNKFILGRKKAKD